MATSISNHFSYLSKHTFVQIITDLTSDERLTMSAIIKKNRILEFNDVIELEKE